jgi:hypothetical protein
MEFSIVNDENQSIFNSEGTLRFITLHEETSHFIPVHLTYALTTHFSTFHFDLRLIHRVTFAILLFDLS